MRKAAVTGLLFLLASSVHADADQDRAVELAKSLGRITLDEVPRQACRGVFRIVSRLD